MIRQLRDQDWPTVHEVLLGRSSVDSESRCFHGGSDFFGFLSNTSQHLCITAPYRAPGILAQLEAQLWICSRKHKINFTAREYQACGAMQLLSTWVFNILRTRTTNFIPFGELCLTSLWSQWALLPKLLMVCLTPSVSEQGASVTHRGKLVRGSGGNDAALEAVQGAPVHPSCSCHWEWKETQCFSIKFNVCALRKTGFKFLL